MKIFWKSSLILILSFLVTLASLFLFHITVSLDSFDRRLESLATKLLERPVTIHGPVQVTFSLPPVLELGKLSIGNPETWTDKAPFLQVGMATGQIDFFPLLKGDIHIIDLSFDDVDIQLVSKADLTDNYSFGSSEEIVDDEPAVHELTGLDTIRLKNIRLRYLDELSGHDYMFHLVEAHGSGMPDSSLQFHLKGEFAGQDCVLDIKGGSLHDLLYGAKPWPLSDGTLQLADTNLSVSGFLIRNSDHSIEYLDAKLQGPNLDGLTALFGVDLPGIDAYSIGVHASILPGRLLFEDIQLSALDSKVEGTLVFSLTGERNLLSGRLFSHHLDRAVFTSFISSNTQGNLTPAQNAVDDDRLPWDVLKMFDADLHLSVQNLSYEEYHLQDIKMILSLVDGDLIIPFSLASTDILLSGEAVMFGSESPPVIDLNVTTKSVEMNKLFDAFDIEQQVSGIMGAVQLSVNSQGESLAQLKEALTVDVSIGRTTLTTDSGIDISSNGIVLKRTAGNPYILTTKGEALGSPFNIKLHVGQNRKKDVGTSEPFKLNVQACNTDLLMEGSIHDDYSAEFQVAATGNTLCGFLSSINSFIGKDADFSIEGKGELKGGDLLLNLNAIQLDEFLFDGKFARKTSDAGNMLIEAFVHSKQVDLRSLFSTPDANKATKDNIQATSVTSPKQNVETNTEDPQEALKQKTDKIDQILAKFLPQEKLLTVDADLRVLVDELITGTGTVSDVKVSAKILDGKLTAAPFNIRLGEEVLSGDLQVDLTEKDPVVKFYLALDGLNLPDLFEAFGIADAPELAIETLEINIVLKGRTLQALPKKSSQEFVIRGGKWKIPKKFGDDLHIEIKEIKGINVPGKKASLTVSGHINGEPLDLLIEENGLIQGDTSKPIVLKAEISLAATAIHFEGKISRENKKAKELNFNYSMSGDRLDKINYLLGVNLPPLGPYSMEGGFHAEKGGFSFHDIILKVGSSTLIGETIVSGSTKGKNTFTYPIAVKTKLQAKSIQLNDFRFGDWSAVKDDQRGEDPDQDAKTGDDDPGTLQNLLSPEIAAEFTGSLAIEVDEVLSGTDTLGSAILKAELKDKQYALTDLVLHIPGGEVTIQGTFKPEETLTTASLAMQIENLDYGVIARRYQPESEIKGVVNVSLDIHSHGENVYLLKDHIAGRFRFGVVPEEYESGSIDLWAVNIVTAALPALLKGTPSTVNCLAGKFVLDDGIMRPENFLLDTSKMRVKGDGELSFKTDEINCSLHPTPKAAHFFSLATPISISGTFTDYSIGVTAGAVLGTVFQLTTSVLTVPYQWLFTDNLEIDGHTACSEAMSWDDLNVQ